MITLKRALVLFPTHAHIQEYPKFSGTGFLGQVFLSTAAAARSPAKCNNWLVKDSTWDSKAMCKLHEIP